MAGLAVAAVGALYLSFGLVYSSETLRWYGAPTPVGALERQPGGDWGDFVGPLGILVGGPNFIFWMGLALAPKSVPYWLKRLQAVGWSKTIGATAFLALVGVVAVHVVPTIEQAIWPHHIVVLRNETSETLRGVGVQCDRSTQYRSKLLAGTEHSFQCGGETSVPRVWKHQALLGGCDEAADARGRFVITLSGDGGDVVRCGRSAQ